MYRNTVQNSCSQHQNFHVGTLSWSWWKHWHLRNRVQNTTRLTKTLLCSASGVDNKWVPYHQTVHLFAQKCLWHFKLWGGEWVCVCIWSVLQKCYGQDEETDSRYQMLQKPQHGGECMEWMIFYSINTCNIIATTPTACTCSDAPTSPFLVVTDLLLPCF